MGRRGWKDHDVGPTDVASHLFSCFSLGLKEFILFVNNFPVIRGK